MSAICGILNLDGTPICQDTLTKFNHSLRDYGGDRANIWVQGSIGIGNQMSCLTHESLTEILPYYHELAKIAITADIRLFNRKELCSQLNLTDILSLSDSQIAVIAYLKYGKDFAKHLLGEYSIVLWDGKTRELICITDHFAHNPIYYYQDKQIFVFASSIDAINQLPQIERKINFRKIALSNYFTSQEIVGETYFNNINFIPHASIMTISANGSRNLQHYWQLSLPKVRQFKSEDGFSEAFQEVFSQVIGGATRTFRPVCSLLSGGLDSSAITAMAAQVLANRNQNLSSLSAVLPLNYTGNVKDESYYINLLNMHNLTKLNITDSNRGPFDNLSNFTTNPNTTSRHYLYRAFNATARTCGAKIILDGCFGEMGPSYWGDEYLGELFRKFKYKTLIHNIIKHKQLFDRTLKSILFHNVLQPNLPQSLQHKLQIRRDLDYITRFSLIKDKFINQYISEEQLKLESNSLKNLGTTPSTDCRYNNFIMLQNWFKRRGTTASTINEQNKSVVRYCYPYLDKRLIEFCLAVPNEFRYKNGFRRYIIRRGMHGILPPELCYRTTKEPFSPDYHNRYHRQIHIARDALNSFKNNSLVQEVLNLNHLDKYLNIEMASNKSYAKNDFIGMQTVPNAIYLASFLVNNS